ncbi:MAG TPA: 3-dehydroquinate synthase family protein [Bacteroidia bacterium]|nr:3-dehydroquinate synthase family protein [Bacteroidia bacterium]
MKININLHIQNEIEFKSIQELSDSLFHQSHILIISEKNIFELYPFLFNNNIPKIILDIHEKNKNIETAIELWKKLIEHNITKHHQIYIIGGGVLNDIALFTCSVFKRGVHCISVPTTLLSMVDASIGGKNGVNFAELKNILGTIYIPEKNIIVEEFLKTLPKEQLLSGWAEILKIALVLDNEFYNECIHFLKSNINPDKSIIQKAIELKISVIQNDLQDNHQRQLLNFGHTIAHAIEQTFESKNIYIPHGIAVANGIIIESFIAQQMNILSNNDYQTIKNDFQNIFPKINLSEHDIEQIIQKITHDKKNTPNSINFTLIEKIGKGKIKIPVTTQIIKTALHNFIF